MEKGHVGQQKPPKRTAKDTVFTSLFRDKGYLLQLYLIFLIEAQSTWTVNILVRVVLYLAKSYQDYIIRTGQDIYGSKKVELPKPEIYVIYTGTRKARPETISITCRRIFSGWGMLPECDSTYDL